MDLQDRTLLRDACFINGEWVSGQSRFPVHNPSTGAVLARVPNLGADETRRAIEAAEAAWPDWRERTANERAAILRRWFDLMHEHSDDLAALMTAEQGKPLTEAKGEVGYAAGFIEWFAEEGKRTYGDVIPEHQSDLRIVVTKEPVGVCGAITPWNFPLAMITRKAGAALAAGCPMVLKPAGETPLSAFALAELAARAGIPDGVFNVITGDAKAVAGELTANPAVRKITFTGSTAVGKLLMQQSADTMKKLSLELGGNAPFIVFDDANLEAAVDGAIASKYRNMGQTCVCANRILVQSGVYDEFAERLATKVAAMKVGDGFAEGVTQGPLINEDALSKVEEHIADALSHGAHVLTGGQRHELGGSFFQPTVLANATPEMKLFGEETFGPVAPLIRFETEREAVAMANDTTAGLASYFYTQDMARTWRVGRHLEYGIVGINTGRISTEVAPFGGVKESGIGREGSKYGIEDYLEVKYMCMGRIDPELK
ncbi:MAG: NAD-dependent succinate-semialdehyde dehydrogenase [Halofilum sp. (in: g-proteobacteria)]